MDNSTFFKQFIVFILLLFVSILSSAQSITGTVTDNEGNAIEFANVVLCADSDSAIISGCTSDEKGNFTLECADKNSKHLQVSFVGYERKVLPLQDTPISVVLEPIAMDEVVIEGHKKIYSMEKGAIVANVKGTILESFPRANDVIARLPFVKGKDGDFTIFGKGTPQIYINNRLVRDKEELEKLSSSEIESIKVITTPGAKYDASVKAVIQIKTYKPQGEGLSGDFYAYSRYSPRWSFREYGTLNYRKGAWDIFGKFYGIQYNEKKTTDTHQRLLIANDMHNITYDISEKHENMSIYPTIGLDFNPNPNHSAGVKYDYYNSDYKMNISDKMNYNVNTINQTINQKSFFLQSSYTHSLNAYYDGNWKDKFFLNINFDWSKGKLTDDMESSFEDNYSEDVNTESMRKHDLYAIKSVFTYTNNENISLDFGGEYAYTNVTQTYNIDNAKIGIDNSDDVTKQNRGALFFVAKTNLKKWGLGAGLRYEYINFDYYQNDIYNKEQSKIYHKLFPNVQVGYSGEVIEWSLEYERKIQYPTYNQLRSNIQYSSPFVYETGNPLLQPQIQNDLTMMLMYNDLQVMASYSFYENCMLQNINLYKNQPIILMAYENIKNLHTWSMGLNYSPMIKWWRPNFEFGVDMLFLELDKQKYNKPIFYTGLDNMFVLPKQWSINLNGYWQSKGNNGIFMAKSTWCVDVIISKSLFDEKLKITLAGSDLFKAEKDSWLVKKDGLQMDSNQYYDNRYVSLRIQYRFNTANSKYKGTSASDESQRL